MNFKFKGNKRQFKPRLELALSELKEELKKQERALKFYSLSSLSLDLVRVLFARKKGLKEFLERFRMRSLLILQLKLYKTKFKFYQRALEFTQKIIEKRT